MSSGTINCTWQPNAELLCNGTAYHEADHRLTTEDPEFWMFLSIYVGLVLAAGIASGLTIGLLTLDSLSLRILRDAGSDEARKFAGRLLPLVKRHHWLLVTLLLANSACAEAMPIFLDRLSDPITAVVVSVTAVFFFGEVLPQALCSRHSLAVGYYCSPIVYLLMFLMSPVSYPLGRLLDCVLGQHPTVFGRDELKHLVLQHGPAGAEEVEEVEDIVRRRVLSVKEVTIIRGALELSSAVAGDACTPLATVFALSDAHVLDDRLRLKILAGAHSRVPVYHGGDRRDIRGCLLVKMLIRYRDDVPVAQLMEDKRCFRDMPFVKDDTQLYDLLDIFVQGKSHMAVVTMGASATVGIITLEDVLERLLCGEIRDESDGIRDDVAARLRRFAASRQSSGAAVSRQNLQRLMSAVSVGAMLQSLATDETTPLLQSGRQRQGRRATAAACVIEEEKA